MDLTTFLSILRGINVGGQKKIQMADLKLLYEELGFKNITTYIQSGNVIFQSKSDKNLSKRIEQQIFKRYGFTVPVIMRTLDELRTLLDENPFLKEKRIKEEMRHTIRGGRTGFRCHWGWRFSGC